MTEFKLDTPVVFIVFNRPDTTQQVFKEIAKAKPPKLLVVADGPRTDRPGEAEKCQATRAVIKLVDWPCEVYTNYAEANLGCKKRVSSGLDWAFELVEEAIILEDDCLPHPTFFRYCQELLEKYREDDRIGLISGCNLFPDTKSALGDYDYFFTKYIEIWGWASWRRVWKGYYDVSMASFPEDGEKILGAVISNPVYLRRKIKEFWDVYNGLVSSWAYPLSLACLSQNLLTVIPKNNMIYNLGFGPEATHTKDSEVKTVETKALTFPLKHPRWVFSCREYDISLESSYGGRLKWLKKILPL